MKDFREIIADRRDGKRHSSADTEQIAIASIPDYQLSAWLMAAFLNPLDLQETADLTRAMADSGRRLDLSSLPQPHVDKHSTGGVGDKTTLVLLPLLAACGLSVVKMSGGGLGITGGTVDKLASIPGFNLQLTADQLLAQAKDIGLALSGQTEALAPADKRLYALRDATATTSSIPLIVSSILSKKLAGGADIILIDVKCGSGAFTTTLTSASELASALEEVGSRCGLKVKTQITDMSQPLGAAVGNALEVEEALNLLSQQPLPPPTLRLRQLCVSLAAETLIASGISVDIADATQRVETALTNGSACAKAVDWISAQGGPKTLEKIIASLPRAKIAHEVVSQSRGWVASLDAAQVGKAVIALGGGRATKESSLDYSVGIILDVSIGSMVNPGTRLFTVHASSEEAAQVAENKISEAIKLSQSFAEPTPLFLATHTRTSKL